jgi:hypothetical protein
MEINIIEQFRELYPWTVFYMYQDILIHIIR